jgi:GR25 family glycosyltransferase involved in LPS biosynthesis
MLPNLHVITLAETPDKTRAIGTHLSEQGEGWTKVRGVNACKMGLHTLNPYVMDGPDIEPRIVEQKHVGLHLSHYFCWSLMQHQGHDEMTIMEDDCRLLAGWRDQYQHARRCLPNDWDILLLGSAHASHRNKQRVDGPVYSCWYPLTTHCYIVNRKALPILIETQEMIFAPIDLALTYRSYPKLTVYTVLPRLAEQDGMPLIP